MRNTRRRSAQKKGGRGRPNLISKMPDDVLIMILSLMPIKDAAVTSVLSTRWRHLWRNLLQLNFDGTQTLEKMVKDEKLCYIERFKYIVQVDNVISSYYNHPMVHDVRIRFDLDDSHSEAINDWVQFALDKKVERLELDLLDKNYDVREPDENYEFWLPSSSMAGEMFSLKKLFLKGVNLNETTLNIILKNSPHLEKLYMFGSNLFPRIHVGGQDINLKHFKLVDCSGFESISLYGFDLVSFIYCGPEIQFHLSDLPKLKELDIGEVSVGLENNVFSQISSCALNLQVLVLDMWSPQKGLDVNAIIKFPNVKKLMLVMGAEEDDCLLEFTSIAQACPRLETFSISLHWYTPTKRRRKVRRVASPHVHEHLKLLEMIGYYGRISDVELAVYFIENAAALEKIVIDPCCHASGGDFTTEDFLKREQAARSSAKHQVKPILPPGVDLVIL
ncbi:putative F-box domain, FBD domain, leucine-rich repeat domain superfamily [Helianthus annuus]|nr:putative F-box domain, FBD domain, leucine-rich repeat domain superfamily [Helianthus annuus]KAJ0630433.1 putative F-box domain, FBD domain, leucine-rich repeat domain superfamily [Helianthus annuus]KAJ0887860.1 putative F-box domain, FBD domain, leucine-rich repeat domain superfamily [Helianthus annuus]KAJ0892788.1 putative F-box domain, FBD domain, leucine-rich repeat domain superfamily [Helianthus annuus]